ncbi:MAG: NAD(P)H-dependent glycerol-3-phosphate dehydrogenase [Paracoccaceae bacterium]
MRIGVLGAGAFGTALAIALGRAGREVVLWARDPECAAELARGRRNLRYLPDARLPESVSVTAEIGKAAAPVLLLAVPMTALPGLLSHLPEPGDHALVACAKGIDLTSGLGPSGLIARAHPGAVAAVLSGPSFAADIARGMPTALTLACRDDARGANLQRLLSTPDLRVYRSTDVAGVELGGALKNVIAIASGVVVGAGFGDSARAALVTRGFAEMTRLAIALGARAETLSGLSGLGDLILTATSPQSRNFRYGLAIGSGTAPDAGLTVEGVATARAALEVARTHGVALPVTGAVAGLIDGRLALGEAVAALMARPLTTE